MPRGPNLTPEELATASATYARTGSFARAAEAIGRADESAVRKAIQRLGCPDLSGLNARAVAVGLERGRVALANNVRALSAESGRFRRSTRERRALVESSTTNAADKHKALAQLSRERIGALVAAAKGLSLSVGRLESLAEHSLGARQKKLTREKTRAEIDALKKGTLLTTEQLLAYLAALPREELLSLIATLKSRREAAAAPAPPPAAPPPPPPEAT
jgi:hypothetical protein